MSMWSRDFWKATAERGISTGAQFAVTLMGADITQFANLDYGQIAVISGVGVIFSVLKSLAAATSDGSPSLGSFEKLK